MDREPGKVAPPSFWRSPIGIACTLLAVVASIYLYLEHKSHVYALLPYLFLAACPLMHVFMHGGHGAHRHSHTGEERKGHTPRVASRSGTSQSPGA